MDDSDLHAWDRDIRTDFMINTQLGTWFEEGVWQGMHGVPAPGHLFGIAFTMNSTEEYAYADGHVDKRRFIAAMHRGSRGFKWEALMRNDTGTISYETVRGLTRHCWGRKVEDDHLAITFEPHEDAAPMTVFTWCWTPWLVECQGECAEGS